MHTVRENHYSPHTPRQLFEMVADVARYPEFLPWCKAARILSREGDVFEAELMVCFKGVCENYVSQVRLFPPKTDVSAARIEVQAIRGPFRHLTNNWEFTPENEGARVNIFLDFQFRSLLLDKMIGGLFERAQRKMIEAFTARADALYA